LRWSGREKEFEKRAGFALAAYLAYRDRKATEEQFTKFLRVIERESDDERNFVRKRSTGHCEILVSETKNSIERPFASRKNCAGEIRAAKRIATDALRELRGDAVQRRLRERKADR
jgi:hypothetical protein